MERAVSSAPIYKFGLFEADAVQNRLTRKGARVRIQDQPFRVLIILLERAGETISREELRQRLWPDGTYVDFDGSLNVILKKLRAAIDDDSDNPRFIETVPRRGYCFIAPVSRSEASVQAPTPVVTTPDVGPNTASVNTLIPSSDTSKRGVHRVQFATVAAGIILLIATLSVAWYPKRTLTQNLSAQAANSPIAMRKSLAVLGFNNTSGKSSDAWLATAFSEMLSTELSAGERLRLVSGEDVVNLRASSPWSETDSLDRRTTSRIGNALNSDLLVLGSYAIVGSPGHERLRLDVRMQDARSGDILTEIAEVGGATDVFQVVSRVGDKLRDRLGIPGLQGNEEATVLATTPIDPQGSRFYALGLSKMREFDWLAAKDLLEQASKADPKSALVHWNLSIAWARLGYEQNRKDESKKALDLAPGLPASERLLIEGNYYQSLADHEKAVSTYRALFQLFPDSVDYGLLLAEAQIGADHASQAAATLAQLRNLPSPASDDPRIDLDDIRGTAQNDPERLVLIRRAVTKAAAQGKKLLYAQARKAECLNLIYSEHPDLGPPACEEAYNIFIAAGNRLEAADCVRILGDHEGSSGHLQTAIATYERALRILEGLGEHLKIGAVLNNMAIDYENEGNSDRAEQLYRQAKLHFEKAGDKRQTALAIGNIGDVFYLRGDLTGASKMYSRALEMELSLDHGSPGYMQYRLADLESAQGRLQQAHIHAQLAIDALRPNQGGYQYLTGAMIILGEVLKAEGDLEGARREFEDTFTIRQKVGELSLVAESQVELADLAIDERRPDQAEPLLLSAISEFEKEKSDPDAASAYTVLSRALLMEGKVEEARKAIQHASELNRTTTDAAQKLGTMIQKARVEITLSNGASTGMITPERELRSSIEAARKSGYFGLELEAQLALGEAVMRTDPANGRSQLATLSHTMHNRGFELLARRAEQASSRTETAVAIAKPTN